MTTNEDEDDEDDDEYDDDDESNQSINPSITRLYTAIDIHTCTNRVDVGNGSVDVMFGTVVLPRNDRLAALLCDKGMDFSACTHDIATT
jgi:hypothetical protein